MMQLHHNLVARRSLWDAAPAGAGMARHPSFDPLQAAFAAGQELYKAGLLATVNLRRAVRRRPPVAWPAVGATPRDEVHAEGPARLYRYRALDATAQRIPHSIRASNVFDATAPKNARSARASDVFDAAAQKTARSARASDAFDATAQKPAILLVCSLINRPYVLDLLDERSVVRRLLDGGLDVWLLDWGTPRADDAERGLAHYALGVLPRMADVARRAAGVERLHLLGYCMGGTLALAAI